MEVTQQTSRFPVSRVARIENPGGSRLDDRQEQHGHGTFDFRQPRREAVGKCLLAEASCYHALVSVHRLFGRHVNQAQELSGERSYATFADRARAYGQAQLSFFQDPDAFGDGNLHGSGKRGCHDHIGQPIGDRLQPFQVSQVTVAERVADRRPQGNTAELTIGFGGQNKSVRDPQPKPIFDFTQRRCFSSRFQGGAGPNLGQRRGQPRDDLFLLGGNVSLDGLPLLVEDSGQSWLLFASERREFLNDALRFLEDGSDALARYFPARGDELQVLLQTRHHFQAFVVEGKEPAKGSVLLPQPSFGGGCRAVRIPFLLPPEHKGLPFESGRPGPHSHLNLQWAAAFRLKMRAAMKSMPNPATIAMMIDMIP